MTGDLLKRPWLTRVAHVALWLPVAAYAAVVIRGFFHYTDRAVYLSTDDAVANIAYALATEGRYGFLSSPVLENMARDQGLFSYGPFYFYVAAALIWLFGYSLTVVRSIHLAVILAMALAARRWFGRDAAGAVGAIVALGLLFTFERGQWPMARPDIMVSFFAVGLVIFAGLAMRKRHSGFWALAGFAAAAGAFTHLVAWSLVPAVLAMLMLDFIIATREQEPEAPRRLWRAVPALAAGGLVGAVIFYASFDFRMGDQLQFLASYQQYTGGLAAVSEPGATYWSLAHEHFTRAYWYLPYPLEYAVWATLFTATALVVALLVGRVGSRRESLALVGPPLIVWLGYLLSLGGYANFHAGYTILNQVMWLWTLGAVGAVAIDGARPWSRARQWLMAAAYVLAVGIGLGVLTILAQRTPYRALAADEAVSITEYTGRVLHALPERATAWGSVTFGIEHPSRVQLVQFDDAITITRTISEESRAALAPDYLIWGVDENHTNARAVMAGTPGLPGAIRELFPATRYTLLSLVAGAPYGVTRVYGRAEGAPPLASPLMALYDPDRRQWSSALGPHEPVALTPVAPVQVDAPAVAGSTTVVQTAQGHLPPGTYLLTLAMSPDLTVGDHAVAMASPDDRLRAVPGAFNGDLDVSPWFPGERELLLVYEHTGGPFFLSLFSTRADAVEGVTAAQLLPLTDYAFLRRPPPESTPLPATAWVRAFPEVDFGPMPDRSIAVVGNGVQFGYQAFAPRIPVEPGQQLTLRVPVVVSGGVACLGVLDGTETRWLVLPDRLHSEYSFQVNDSRTIRPVLADCTGVPEGVEPVRAIIGDGSYEVSSDRDGLYVDRLMRLFREQSAHGSRGLPEGQ